MHLKITILYCLVFFTCCNQPERRTYELQTNWPQSPKEVFTGKPSGLAINMAGDAVVFHRSGSKDENGFLDANTLTTLDEESGRILNAWGAGMFINPHGLTIDNANNIWVTDTELHQVFKFSEDGKRLLVLGEARVSGADGTHFNKPTDVAVLPDGSFYVSDGYGNSRVCKFSPEGKYLFEWGTKGKAPGQFNLPHGVDVDMEGKVYVADRENNRVQKFTGDGEFVNQWQSKNGGGVYAVKVDTSNSVLYVVDYLAQQDAIAGSDVSILDLSLNKQNHFGRSGDYVGPICRYHDVEVDKKGNIYTADLLNLHVHKFTHKR